MNLRIQLQHGGTLYNWLFWLLLSVLLITLRPKIYKVMILSGLFSLPIVIFYSNTINNYIDIIKLCVMAFCLGSFCLSIYELTLHNQITPVTHPMRRKLMWTVVGLITFFIIWKFLSIPLVFGALFALFINIVIVLLLNKQLIWDTIYSGAAIGVLYIIITVFTNSITFRTTSIFWYSDYTSGFYIYSNPIEFVLSVFIFGVLWGPLYISAKDWIRHEH